MRSHRGKEVLPLTLETQLPAHELARIKRHIAFIFGQHFKDQNNCDEVAESLLLMLDCGKPQNLAMRHLCRLPVNLLIALNDYLAKIRDKFNIYFSPQMHFKLIVLINDKNQFAKNRLHKEIVQTLKHFSAGKLRFANLTLGYLARKSRDLFDRQSSNQHLYRLLLLLIRENLLTLDDERRIYEYLHETRFLEINHKSQNKAYYKAQQTLLNVFYQKFSALVDQGIEVHFLKRIKKHIHGFAEENGFPKCIFNIDKIHNSDADVLEDSPQKYAYIPKNINIVTHEKRVNRDIKFVFAVAGSFFSVILGFCEAAMAFLYLGPVALVWRIITFVSSFVCNYILVNSAIVNTTRDVYFNGFFGNHRARKVSWQKKLLILGSFFFALASSIGFGVLSFMSASHLLQFVAGAVVASSFVNPIALSIIAGTLSLVSGICMFYLFFNGFSNFIKNDGYKEVGEYFRTKMFFPAHQEPNVGNYCRHILAVSVRVMLLTATLFALLALAAAGGPFYASAIKSVATGFSLSSFVGSITGKVVSYGFATPMNSFFSANGMFKTADKLADFIIALPSVLQHTTFKLAHWGKKVWRALVDRNKQTFARSDYDDLARDIGHLRRAARVATLGALAVPNACGQMHTYPSTAASTDLVCQITGLSTATTQKALLGFGFCGTFGPNTVALQQRFIDVRGQEVDNEIVDITKLPVAPAESDSKIHSLPDVLFPRFVV